MSERPLRPTYPPRPTEAEIMTSLPRTPAEIAAKARSLRAAVVGAVPEISMVRIMHMLEIKALAGDLEAVRLLLKLNGAGADAPPPQVPANVMQVNVDQAENVMLHSGEPRPALAAHQPSEPDGDRAERPATAEAPPAATRSGQTRKRTRAAR